MKLNVYQYSNLVEQNWVANLGDMTDFRPKFTFYSDFAIAEFCEVYMRDTNAVKKTFNNLRRYWLSDIKAATEIALVLNHKSWAFHAKVDSHYLGCSEEWRKKFIELYTKLYYEWDGLVTKKFANDKSAMSYYYRVLD